MAVRPSYLIAAAGAVCVLAVVVVLAIWLPSSGGSIAIGEGDWPMPGGGPTHLSYLPLAPGGQLRELWSTRLESELAGPPAVADGRAYVACEDGFLYCLELGTGRPVWRHDAGASITSMPAVYEKGIMLATSDGRVQSLSPEGKLAWEAEVGDAVSSTPVPAGGRVFFGSEDGFLYCLNASNGDRRWSYRAEGPVQVSPCVYGKQVLGVSYEGDLVALEADSGRLVWTFQSHGIPVTCPAADDERVFLATEFEAFCLDAQSGKLLWKYATGPTVISNLALRGNQVILVIGGEGLVSSTLNLDARTGDRLWNVASGETASRTLIYATNKDVYLCGRDHLRALSAESGVPSFETEMPDALPHTLTLTDELVLIGARNRKVYCYGE